MPKTASRYKSTVVLRRSHLDSLLQVLQQKGYQTVAPVVRDGVIVYDQVTYPSDMPHGKTDEQEGGRYRLHDRQDDALFGYVVGPHSWKRFLHPPVLRLWQAEQNGNGLQFHAEQNNMPRYAFIGVRSCELHAIVVQDKVFLESQFVDPNYKVRRDGAFIVAVNCTEPGGTCFCASMNTGPKATSGFDLCLTEVLDDGDHYFLVEVGSRQGAEVIKEVPHDEVKREEREVAEHAVKQAADQMGRQLDTDGIKELLLANYENAHWDDVAERCMTCANCTMVCPTCFCTTVEDVTDLTGKKAERWRKWDSCYTKDFSYVHGGSIRTGNHARYRQWLTHKFASWYEQFGTSGCVGCGRCITWCPVGIDVTAEIAAIRANSKVKRV